MVKQPSEETLTFKNIPFPDYISPSDASEAKIKIQERKLSPYYCLVSTLMPEDGELAYRYSAFQIKIPKDIIGNVEKGENQRQWLTFKLSDARALRHNKADPREEEGIIRMARCRLPAIPQMIEKVRAYLMKFDEESWAYEHKNEDKMAPANTDSAEGSVTAPGWECSAYLHYFWCMAPNVEDPWNNPDCVYRFSECVEWIFVEYPSPGGGGSGGNDPDPCAPCQPGMPCENTGGTPSGCAPGGGNPGLPTDPCIGDPVPTPEIAPTPLQGTAGGRWGAPRSDGTPHNGLDIKSPIDGPLYSMFGGTVISAEASSATFGKYIIVRSNYEGENIWVLYAHLNSRAVSDGDQVSAGSFIGRTGDTGNAAGTVPHVHIEVRKQVDQYGYNNAPDFNPEKYMTTKFDENGNPIPSNCN